MEEYLGLLLSFTEGLNFPKKKLYLNVRYSRYTITFPVVNGGKTTVFNQGYFFRNVKVEGHDESDLPVLIQAFEKKSLFKSVLIAELRVEAFNFYNFDMYEPLLFCLTPIEKYKEYKCQLKVMFQLVKPTAEFVCSKSVDINTTKPIAFQIDISSASINEELVDKTLYFSCQLNVNATTFVKTRDVKGSAPQWSLRQIISACDFSDSNNLGFTIYSVTHPHQQASLAPVGETKIPIKKIVSSLQPQFELPIMGKKKEVGNLNVSIRPIYAQSRDGTANSERIYQLQPNAFASTMDKPVGISSQPISHMPSMSHLLSAVSSEVNTSIPPVTLREGSVMSPTSSQSNTLKSERLSQASQQQLQMMEESSKPISSLNVTHLRESILGDLSNPSIDQFSPRDSTLLSRDGMSLSTDLRSYAGTEIKKVVMASPIEEKVDMSKVYISKCTAIVRKTDSTRNQGLRLKNRVKHEYIESLTYVF